HPAGPLDAGRARTDPGEFLTPRPAAGVARCWSSCRGIPMSPRYRLCYLALPVLLALLGTGCQRELPYGVVEGEVTLDGKPLTDVEVVFLPDPDRGTQGRRSVALVDREGRYRLASDAGRAGAPVGFHRVCVIDMRSPPWAP